MLLILSNLQSFSFPNFLRLMLQRFANFINNEHFINGFPTEIPCIWVGFRELFEQKANTIAPNSHFGYKNTTLNERRDL